MAVTKQKPRKPVYTEKAAEERRAPAAPARTQEERDKAQAETDELLDTIDEVLEVNAEEFVRNYVQKGGE
jgi:ubiquitin-like protein Pup